MLTPTSGLDRDLAASAFLVAGSIISLVLARTALRLNIKSTAYTGNGRMEIKCPNCGTLQTLGTSGACRQCLLRFHIQLTEPHCPACDHLLLNLESSRCPECGHAINRPAQRRQAPPHPPRPPRPAPPLDEPRAQFG